ncbi:glutamine synthetase [Candidatus Peregrinibacteria bacterium]|nr:glutamine synthetase [Candidatus Peregrinibacteria bacterium]
MPVPLPITPRFKTSQDFLELAYDEIQERNTAIKRDRESGKDQAYFREKLIADLKKEVTVKAVTVCFSDMEGKLHMLDYNKTFLLDSHQNLTFDGSSIKGFTPQQESDLRLTLDWSTFKWLPSDIFGAGKVMVFADVYDKDGTPYKGDFRSNLKELCEELKKSHGITVNVAPEIEGFLFEGENAEHCFDEHVGFKLATKGGYFNALPQDLLRQFIDRLAEATRAMAFENEKDHPEVAPSQFELNYKYTDVLYAADQIQIYKITARQIAKRMGMTACFLPKPVAGINGSGMHTNISLSQNGKNIFYDKSGVHGLSDKAHHFILGILNHGADLCLSINPSVNAYRRLDPHFEAPNEIKVSPVDRGSMIRIPLANEKSARIEVRTVAPDANPYFSFFILIKAGLKGMFADPATLTEYKKLLTRPTKKLPGTIYEAISAFKRSEFIKEVLSENNRQKFITLKEAVANRSPLELGTRLKNGEVWYHHEVTNQVLWNSF